ncbi:MAG: hypothetical protein ACK56F_19535 [bacterium]
MSDDEDETPVSKRGTEEDQDSANLPAFINKLLQMLVDPECNGVFQYGADGNTILVVDNTLFSSVIFTSVAELYIHEDTSKTIFLCNSA